MSDGQQTGLGVASNVGSTLCYAPCWIGVVFSIVAVIVEKKDRSIRFHAFQSLLLHGAAIVASIGVFAASVVAGFASGMLAGLIWLLEFPIGLAVLGLAIFMMVKAYGHEDLELPVIGPLAKQWSAN